MKTYIAALCCAVVTLGCSQTELETAEELNQASEEIVGGVTENAHWYVGMVSPVGCTGTLISKRTVLTAGHCSEGAVSRVDFDTGNPLKRTSVTVTERRLHPSYNLDSDTLLHNDLMLLKLAADAPVQPAPLLREAMANNAAFLTPLYSFVGYGRTSGTGIDYGTRRVVTFPIYAVGPMSLPRQAGSPSSAVTAIDATEFYYRVPGKNTCNGDSGGPAFVVRQGVERHAGTTSFGDTGCAYDGVQSRTDSTTLAWIQQTITSFEMSDACSSNGVCDPTCVSTSPAPLGTLNDPDCAEAHCAADGVCVLSCSPVDPDCASLNINNCATNGICQPGCATADKDCLKQSGATCAAASECQSGSCVEGMCCNTACAGACQACSVAAGGRINGICTIKAAGATCRAAAGSCDVAETCNGTSTTCPADTIRPALTVCRPSTGPCDNEERCTGSSGACPTDSFKPNTFVCRSPVGVCDVAETCTGNSAPCPADAMAAPTVVCRASTAPCDAEETCTGTSNTCPPDQLKATGSVCRAAAGGCDKPETCDGETNACPTDALMTAGEVCRAAAGVCDTPETCTGTVDCPTDAFLTASTVCRASTGACDEAESCSGSAATCPADAAKADGATCSGGQCGGGVCKVAGKTVPPGDHYESKGCGCTGSPSDTLLRLVGLFGLVSIVRRRDRRGRKA